MIQDAQELSASLQYAASWADKLEALRRHSTETESALLSTTAAGPLAEIRRVLLEAREFAERLAEETAKETKVDTPVEYHITALEREKVA